MLGARVDDRRDGVDVGDGIFFQRATRHGEVLDDRKAEDCGHSFPR